MSRIGFGLLGQIGGLHNGHCDVMGHLARHRGDVGCNARGRALMALPQGKGADEDQHAYHLANRAPGVAHTLAFTAATSDTAVATAASALA